jgi:WD40 repeat protein
MLKIDRVLCLFLSVLWVASISVSAQTPTFVPQRGHSSGITRVAFNSSGTLLASCGTDGRLILWDVSSGLMLSSFDVKFSSPGRAIGFSSDGQNVFFLGEPYACAFEVSSGVLKWKRALGALFAAASARGNRAAYFPAPDLGKSRTLKIIDSSSGRDLGNVATDCTIPSAIAFSPDGHLLAVGCGDGSNLAGSNVEASPDHRLTLYDAESGSAKLTLATSSAWCSTVAFSEKGDLVAAVSYDKIGRSLNECDNVTLQVWELSAGTERLRVRLSYKLSLAQSLCFDGEGNNLAVGIGGNDVPHQGELLLINGAGVVSRVPSPVGPVFTLAYDKHHGVWAGAGGGAMIQLWDHWTKAAVAAFASHTAAIESANLNGPGDKLILSTDRGETLILDLALGEAIRLPLRKAVISSESQVVAGIGEKFDRAVAYDLGKEKELLQTEPLGVGTLNAVTLDKTGSYLIESLDPLNQNSSTINVWDIFKKQKVLTTVRPASTRLLKVLPSGDVLVVEDANGLALWRLSTHEKLGDVNEPADSALLWVDAFRDYLTRVVSKANGNEMKVNLTAVSVGDKVSITRPGTPPELPVTLPEFVEGVGPGHTLVASSGFAKVFYDWQTRRYTVLDYVLLDSNSNVFKRVYESGRYAMVNVTTNQVYGGSLDQLKLPVIEHCTFTPDGKHYVALTTSGNALIWSLETGHFERLMKGDGTRITAWSFSNDGRLMAAATPLGEALLWNLQSGELVATFLCLSEGDWIARDGDGQHFMGTKTAEVKVAYRIGDLAIPFEQFDLLFNRPDIVLEHIGVASRERIEAAQQAFDARALLMGVVPTQSNEALPQVILPELDLDTASVPVSTESMSMKFTLKAAAPQGASLAQLIVYDNDVPVFGKAGIHLSGNARAIDLDVPLVVGSNIIEFTLMDSQGVESLRRDVRVVRIDPLGRKPKLFVATVGVSKNRDGKLILRYAAKDAVNVASAFKGLVSFDKVQTLTLIDSQVSGNFLNQIRAFLAQAALDDEVVLFISAHGVRDANGKYHVVTFDFDPTERSRLGITADDLEDIFDQVPARKRLVFLDTCFSGPDSGYADQLVDLRRGSGAVVIAAAGPYDPSYEGFEFLKNVDQGIFAYALIHALLDPKITTVSALRDAISDDVADLSHQHEKPVSRNENLRYNFQVK